MPDTRELGRQANSSNVFETTIKREPGDETFLLHANNVIQVESSSLLQLGPENEPNPIKVDTDMDLETEQPIRARPMAEYIHYLSATDIAYSPESAIAEIKRMSKSIATYISKLELRTDPNWNEKWEELQGYEKRRVPRTKIAVCGPTGAGKSTLINALLGDNILPTSDSGACTAVITEIAYHEENETRAEVEFFPRSEWESELQLLLEDISDGQNDGAESLDVNSVAKIAWHRVRSVYPQLRREEIIGKTPDYIINKSPHISDRLGKTIPVPVAKNSSLFSAAIAEFIDSSSESGGQEDSTIKYWPLIRRVCIWTKSEVLRGGVVLVDLPGDGDANPIRSRDAKGFLQNAKYIWIVAPILRLSDNQGVHDLLNDAYKLQLRSRNYTASSITLIATNSDHVDCSRTIDKLRLEADPELVEIEGRLQQAKGRKSDFEVTKINKTREHIKEQIGKLRPIIQECQAQLERLGAKDLEGALAAYKPALLELNNQIPETCVGSPKVCRFTEQDPESMDVDELEGPSTNVAKDKGSESVLVGWMNLFKKAREDEATLITKLQQYEHKFSEAKVYQFEHQCLWNDANKQKAAFCAAKRNKKSKEDMQSTFWRNLFAVHEGSSETRGANYRTSANTLSDAASFAKMRNIPVFTCSPLDFICMQDDANGQPRTFTKTKETEIPKLREWCGTLTIPARQQAAEGLMEDLGRVMCFIRRSIDTWDNKNPSACLELAAEWQTNRPRIRHYYQDSAEWGGLRLQGTLQAPATQAREVLAQDRSRGPQPQKGLSIKLQKQLRTVSVDFAKWLKQKFRQELLGACTSGAENARIAAVGTSDELAAMRWWQVYQAILRRNGEYKEYDLNAKLISPIFNTLILPWARLFGPGSTIFDRLTQDAEKKIKRILDAVTASADESIKQDCKNHCAHSRIESLALLRNIRDGLEAKLADEQRNLHRILALYVKHQLMDGYQSAGRIRGKGTSERSKKAMHNYIAGRSGTLFSDTCQLLFRELDKIADQIELILRLALNNVSEKIEVNVSSLWNMSARDKLLAQERLRFVGQTHSVLYHLKLWTIASKAWVDQNGSQVM